MISPGSCSSDESESGLIRRDNLFLRSDLESWSNINISNSLWQDNAKKNQIKFKNSEYETIFSVDGFSLVRDRNSQKLFVFPHNQSQVQRHFAISPDECFLAKADSNHSINCYDIELKECVGLLKGHTDLITGIQYSREGDLIISSSLDGTLRFWQTSTLNEIVCWPVFIDGERKGITSFDVTKNGETIITSGYNGIISVWNTGKQDKILTIEAHESPVTVIKFLPDEEYYVSASGDSSIKIWSLNTNEEVLSFICDAIPILSLSISPDADYIAALYADNSIRVFSVTYGKCISVFNPPPAPMTREFPLKVSTIDPPVKSYPVQNLVFPSLPFIESQIRVPTIKEVVLKGIDDFACIQGTEILSTEPPRSQPINISLFPDSLFSTVIEPRDLVSISVQTKDIGPGSIFPGISSEVRGTDYLKEIITPPEIVDLTYQVPAPDTTANIAVSPLSEVLFIPDIFPSFFDSPGDFTIISSIMTLPGIQEKSIPLDLLTESCPTTRLFPLCDIFPLTVYPLIQLEIFPEPEPCIIEPETILPPLNPPYLFLNQENEITLHFPEQKFYSDYLSKQLVLSSNGIQTDSNQIILEKNFENNVVFTNACSCSLSYISHYFEIILLEGKNILKTWTFQSISDKYPFLAFKDNNKKQIPSRELLRERVWIITKCSIENEGVLEYGSLNGTWSQFYYYLVNPSAKIDVYLKCEDELLYQLPFIEPQRTPELIGERIEGIMFKPDIPWYTKIPTLIVPYELNNDSINCQIHIYQESYNFFKSFDLFGKREFLKNIEDKRIIRVDLSNDELLGKDPLLGTYKLVFQNIKYPPIIFNLVSKLEVNFSPPIICLNSNNSNEFHIEIKGPDDIICSSPKSIKIRDGFFKLEIDTTLRESYAQTVDFNIFYKIHNFQNQFSIDLQIILPIINYSINGVIDGHEPVDSPAGPKLLKEYIENTIEKTSIQINKPNKFQGLWRIKFQEQYSKRIGDDNSERLSFSLKEFRDTIHQNYEKPIPFELEYSLKNNSYISPLFSLINWNISELEISHLDIEDKYRIIISGKEIGRVKNAYVKIYDKDILSFLDNVEVYPTLLPPPSNCYDYTDFKSEFRIEEPIPDNEYIFGFTLEENESDWGTPEIIHQIPVIITKDVYRIANWYFIKGKYEKSFLWLDKIKENQESYSNAILLKAKIIGFNAELIDDKEEKIKRSQEAIDFVDIAINLNNDNNEFFIEKAHLLNRLAFFCNNNKNYYNESSNILIEILQQNPLDINAIIERGLSLIGMGASFEGMKVYQFLEHLDPEHNDPHSLWGRANLLYLYSKLKSGNNKKKNFEKSKSLIEESLKLEQHNPLYNSFYNEIKHDILNLNNNNSINSSLDESIDGKVKPEDND